MARIRTLKPEFWTDEKIVTLPYETRLFFQGMWNFADDCGHIENEPLRLKLQILPHDPVDASEQIKALVDAGLVEQRSGCLLIPGFEKHQRIDKASSCRFPEDSTKPLRGRRDTSSTPRNKKPRKGREGNGKEGKGGESRATRVPKDFAVPEDQLLAAKEKYPLLDFPTETAKFLDYHTSKGSTFKDWMAAWRNWIRQAETYRLRDSGSNGSYRNDSEWTLEERGLA